MLASLLIFMSILIVQAVMLSAPRPAPIPVRQRRRDVTEHVPISD
jgi:hypothetical protein